MFPNLGGFMHQVGKHGASFGCGRAPGWFANRPLYRGLFTKGWIILLQSGRPSPSIPQTMSSTERLGDLIWPGLGRHEPRTNLGL